MSSSGRLLKKLRKIMGVAVASSSLVACSSQISCGVNDGVFCYDLDHKGELTISPYKLYSVLTADNRPRLTFRGIGKKILEPLMTRAKVEKIESIFIGDGIDVEWDYHRFDPLPVSANVSYSKGNITVKFYNVTKTLHFSGSGVIDGSWEICFDRESVRSVIIDEGIIEIGEAAFDCCTNLEVVNIPKGIIKIGESAFEYCEKLKELTLPSSVKTIGKAAFCNCRNLEKINIPKDVTEIDNSAFYRCENLQNVNIPKGVTRIGDSAFFDCVSLRDITFPSSVEMVERYAFFGCSVLQKAKFVGQKRLSIADGAFRACENLECVEILKLPGCCVSFDPKAFMSTTVVKY